MQYCKSLYLLLAVAAVGCGGNKGPVIQGTVANADKGTVYLETAVMNNWSVTDSAKTDGDGSFKIKLDQAPAEPAVYRLAFGGKYIYLPVDSVETVTVTADAKHFDTGYTLAGNIYAAAFATADSLVSASVAANGAAAALNDPALKSALNNMVNADTTCLVSFYIVGKTIDGQMLYRPENKNDVRVIANAANNYARLRPGDSRAQQLLNRWMTMRRIMGNVPTQQVTMQADIKSRPQVKLVRYDRLGNPHDFDKVVDRGGVTVLNLTRYDTEFSQPNTVALKEVYNRYKADGLQIYQISYEPDEIAWKRSAANMPWIAVWNSPTDDIQALMAYNANPVDGAPVSYVFNRNGELIERVNEPSKLAAAVAKAF